MFQRWKGITDCADLVILMEEGTVKEQGTHKELMDLNDSMLSLRRLMQEGQLIILFSLCTSLASAN